MRQRLLIIASVIAGSAILSHRAAESAELPSDIAEALSQDAAVSANAIQRLRAGGQTAFEELLAVRDEHRKNPDRGFNIKPAQFDQLIDQVGAARYSSVSGLFWHTDMRSALAEAKASQKPILSLRMMGKLTDEYSCANSRFFRTTLYANQEISQFLREHFVLHWKSVRPVPKVTIDFGDGRKLERTLTGNSIHYVLTSQGRVIDGLPGLYSPARFLTWLKEIQRMQTNWNQMSMPGDALAETLKRWHGQQASAMARRWQRDLDGVGRATENFPQPNNTARVNQAQQANPPAEAATQLAIPKSAVEMPLLANIVPDTSNLQARTDDNTWEAIADRYRPDVKLDQASVDLIRSENPLITERERTKEGDPVLRLVDVFEKAIAIDTVRNEYLLHLTLHEWLAEGTTSQDVEKLNERVYTELFLTPRHDPWIGLVPPDTYSGLTNGGAVVPK